MAVIALNRSVGSEKRKTILVIPDLLDRDVPTLNSVALRAVGAHLALVNVSVAILAVFSYVGEDRLDVALRAAHLFVHAAERVFGFVVIEFGNRANGTPSGRSVAILARNTQRAMRASGCLPLGQRRGSTKHRHYPQD